MASINDGYKFIYSNQSSDEYGVRLCDFDSSNIGSNDEETEIITTTNSYKDTWDYHGKVKSAPLKFQITICKYDGNGVSGYFDNNEERAIKKWLIRSKRNLLQIDQIDLSDTYYNCLLTFNSKQNVARGTAGLVFDVICDATTPWSGLYKKSYTTVNNTLTFKLNMILDFDDYLVQPTLIIQPTANGTCTIKNITTNEEVIITDCVTTEIITLNCATDQISSSSNRLMIDSWNKNGISLCEGLNNLTLTGAFKLSLEYRLPIRVGA